MTQQNKLLKALHEFTQAANNFLEVWQNNDHSEMIIENYPFNKSFDNVLTDIKKWESTHLESEETINVYCKLWGIENTVECYPIESEIYLNIKS